MAPGENEFDTPVLVSSTTLASDKNLGLNWPKHNLLSLVIEKHRTLVWV